MGRKKADDAEREWEIDDVGTASQIIAACCREVSITPGVVSIQCFGLMSFGPAQAVFN